MKLPSQVLLGSSLWDSQCPGLRVPPGTYKSVGRISAANLEESRSFQGLNITPTSLSFWIDLQSQLRFLKYSSLFKFVGYPQDHSSGEFPIVSSIKRSHQCLIPEPPKPAIHSTVPEQQHGQRLGACQESKLSALSWICIWLWIWTRICTLIIPLSKSCAHQVLEAQSYARAFRLYLLVNICGYVTLSSNEIYVERQFVENLKTEVTLVPLDFPWRPHRILVGCFGFQEDLVLFP